VVGKSDDAVGANWDERLTGGGGRERITHSFSV
jgi:hypothetical protein